MWELGDVDTTGSNTCAFLAESALEELESKRTSGEKAALEGARDEFAKKAQKLGEILYAQAQQEAGAQAGPDAAGGPEATAGSEDDEPVDADFEVKS